MKALEQKYQAYRSKMDRLEKQIDAWYEIAGQKFSEGDKAGQKKAYAEIDALQAKKNALTDPMEENDELLS